MEAPSGQPESFAPPGGPAAPTGAQAASTASLLGLSEEHDLDDMKAQATHVFGTGRQKRAKLTHGHFFDHENGFKKLLREFSRIKFRGKGHEFDDLKVLLSSYGQWFKQLYPTSEKLEDLVWRARSVLQEKAPGEDGEISDPRERLHMLRFKYKSAKKSAAASAKWAGEAAAQMSDEVKARIAANRARALELKKKKAAEAAAAAGNAPEGGQQRNHEPKRKREEEAFPFDDEDVFGFGGGFDADGGAPQSQPIFFEEEDVFGFGGGFDEEDAPPPAPPPAPKAQAQPQPAPAPAPASALGEDVLRMIQEKRQKAAELKRKKQAEAESKAAAPAAAQQQPPPAQQQPAPSQSAAKQAASLDDEDLFGVPDVFQEEEDPFGLGGGMDE